MNRRTFMKSVGVVATALGIGVTAKAATEKPKREMQGIFWVEGSGDMDFTDPQPIAKEYIELLGLYGVVSVNLPVIRNQEFNRAVAKAVKGLQSQGLDGQVYAKFRMNKKPHFRFIRIRSDVSGIKCYFCDSSKRYQWLDEANMLRTNNWTLDLGLWEY